MQCFFDIMMLILSCAIGFIMQRIVSKVGTTFIMTCVILVVGVLMYYVFSWLAEWLSPKSRCLAARFCMVYLSLAAYAYSKKGPPLLSLPAQRFVKFLLCLLAVLIVPLLFLLGFLGCRSEVSLVGYDAIRAKPVSVAAAHYFPTGDGRGDETYEIVLRNAAAAPFELSLEFTHFLSVGMRRTRMGKG